VKGGQDGGKRSLRDFEPLARYISAEALTFSL